jgi:adenylyltransferase and sulfurtransferase
MPQYTSHAEHLTPTNAGSIVSQYDVVLDCTDHPASRYLVSDICVLLQKPLVSASALRTDGQLIVLNCPPAPKGSTVKDAGPCYRCVWPKPPPAEMVLSCGEGGILGPVVGVMGVLQALEALKIIAGNRHQVQLDQQGAEAAFPPPTLTTFSSPADGPPIFRNLRMRGRRKDCFACSASSTLTLETLANGSLDYVQFCGGLTAAPDLLSAQERISATELSHALQQGRDQTHSLILYDVRERPYFDIAAIPGAVNMPYSEIQQRIRSRTNGLAGPFKKEGDDGMAGNQSPIYVVCRVGNDSQAVVRHLQEVAKVGPDGQTRQIVDVIGGVRAWKRDVDPTMPFI